MSLQKLAIDKRWTLFLDRDGVINKLLPNDYVKSLDEFEWLPGVKPTLVVLSKIFARIIIITNQQGVGKGVMNEEDLERIHTMLTTDVRLSGGRIDAIYAATCLKEEDTKKMRKPNTGMLLLAQEQFEEIDFKKSIVVGDSLTDMQMGHALGLITIACNNPQIAEHADYFVPNLTSVLALLEYK